MIHVIRIYYRVLFWIKDYIKIVLHFKENKNRLFIAELPQVSHNNAISQYLLYWFAENIQYYTYLRMRRYSLPFVKRIEMYLDGGEFSVLNLDFTYQEYFEKKIKSPERALIRKAIKNGFTVKEINYDDHLTEIQEINNSKLIRGGRSMSHDYIHVRFRDAIVKKINPNIYTFGCFSEAGQLVAYYMFERFTNFYHTVKGIGHSDYLNFGVMNYLFAYSISELSKKCQCMHLVYGIMGDDGLSRFKRNVGCYPCLMVYRGSKEDMMALQRFIKTYKLHDDSALNFIHEYILKD